MPEQQSYANHAKIAPAFHYVLAGMLLLTLIGSCWNVYRSLGNHARLYNAALILVLTVAVFLLAFLARTFALKAQDRAIRAEENLRHYALTGKLLDPRLSLRQIIGLRFASDTEFPALASKAANESMTLDGIKRAVKTWRPDHDRL